MVKREFSPKEQGRVSNQDILLLLQREDEIFQLLEAVQRWTPDGNGFIPPPIKETTADHTKAVMEFSMSTLISFPRFASPIDHVRVQGIALVHDLGERDTGDVLAHTKDLLSKEEQRDLKNQERESILGTFEDLGLPDGLIELYDSYENWDR